MGSLLLSIRCPQGLPAHLLLVLEFDEQKLAAAHSAPPSSRAPIMAPLMALAVPEIPEGESGVGEGGLMLSR